MKQRALFLLLIGLTAAATAAMAQESNERPAPAMRKYNPGEEYSYRLDVLERHNGREGSRILATSRHTVVEKDGTLGEYVRWQALQIVAGGDTLLFDSLARQATPYFISHAAKGTVELPSLKIPEMVGPITDLNTFFVAVHPSEGISRLSNVGDVHVDTSVVRGDFADSIQVMLGNDCLKATYRLLRIDEDAIVYETTFAPPAESCLPLLREDMSTPVVTGIPNNFQMIRAAGPGKVNLMWGSEGFTITSTVQRSTGRILTAAMRNTLRLKLRINCDPELKAWQFEMPFTIEREVGLELVKD